MRKAVFLAALLVLLPAFAVAGDTPKAEVFGGYQYLHVSDNGFSQGFNGWDAALTGNVTKEFGITGDFSGSYATISGVKAHVYTYAFGPTVNLNHNGVLNPFAHALFGGAHLNGSVSGSGSASTNGFAMAIGGGADAKVAPHIAVRLGQFDWVYYRFEGQGFSKNFRYSGGIVFRF